MARVLCPDMEKSKTRVVNMRCLIIVSMLLIWSFYSGVLLAADTVKTGTRIGAIKVKQSNGKDIEIEKIKGDKLAVIAFWSPAPAVKKEIEKMHGFIKKQDDRIMLILISRGKNEAERETAIKSAEKIGKGLPLYFDPDLSAAKWFAVKSVPWFIAVARNNTILTTGANSIEAKLRNLTFERILLMEKGGENIPFHELIPAKPGDKARELINTKAPDFKSKDLNAVLQSPRIYEGKKPLFIVFWRESCPHCRKEMPRLTKFYSEYKNKKDFEMIGIAITAKLEDDGKVKTYIKNEKIMFPNIVDSSGKTSAEYKISEVPSIFYIDKKGIIRDTQTGETEQLSELLLSFLKM
ncbi:MAG: TlpA disulfide reductase family protein [bacterium]